MGTTILLPNPNEVNFKIPLFQPIHKVLIVRPGAPFQYFSNVTRFNPIPIINEVGPTEVCKSNS